MIPAHQQVWGHKDRGSAARKRAGWGRRNYDTCQKSLRVVSALGGHEGKAGASQWKE